MKPVRPSRSHERRRAGRWHLQHVGRARHRAAAAADAARSAIAQLEERVQRLVDPRDERVLGTLVRRVIVFHECLREIGVRLVRLGLANAIAAHAVQICSFKQQDKLDKYYKWTSTTTTFEDGRGPQLDVDVRYLGGQLHGRRHHVHGLASIAQG